MKLIAGRIPLDEKQACALFIVFVFVAKIFAVLTYGADLALFPAVYNSIFCPPHCWYAGIKTTIPYSIVWYYFNLFFLFPDTWTGRFWYGVYVFALDAVSTLIFWKIKRIPKFYLAMSQGMSVMFYLNQGSEYQNISIIVLMPLAFFALPKTKKWFRAKLGALLAIPILVKMPLGWTLPWDFSNPHVQCLYTCNGLFNNPEHVVLWGLLAGAVSNYAILCFTWYYTLQTVRGKYGRKQ